VLRSAKDRLTSLRRRVSIKRIGLTVAVLAAAFALFALTMPRRKNVVLKWARGKVQVAQGCTAFTPGIFDGEDRFAATVHEIKEVERDGPIAMHDTPIGSIWYPAGAWTLPALVEASAADHYHWRSTVKPGDVVLDVGASVGTETRSALSAGAGRVIAIEPEPISLQCLRRNLSAEIREKRVVVVPDGVWDKDGVLTLNVSTPNVSGATFVMHKGDEFVQVPVRTIDHIVADLNLPKVDVIKIHVEGAEKQALMGASETIRRYHPRLAIALEHNLKDVSVLPGLVRRLWPGYHVELTPCTKTLNTIHPQVALLRP
jgi:FkbM family methyltransferase